MHFSFPKKDYLLQKWLNALKMPKSFFLTRKSPKICTLHFEETEINRNIFKITLKGDCVPSKNLNSVSIQI